MPGAPRLVDRRTAITPEDDLIADGGSDRNANLVLGARALVAAAAKGGTAMTTAGLAKASGLSEPTVVRLLGSPEARELLRGAALEQVQLVIPKAIAALGEMLENRELAPLARIQAAKVAFEGYKLLATAAPAAENASAVAGASALLEALAKSRARRMAVHVGPTP